MQTNIYGGGTSSFFQTYRWHSNSNKIPFWLWSNTKHLYFRCFFGLRFWVGIYLWVTPQNGDLSFGYLRAKIKNTEIVAVVETFAFNNGSALKPFSTWFNYTPDYARGICSPVSINGSLAAAGAGRSGTNLKVDLADSNYTGTIWVSMILVASSN